jgi:hypothetical protein
MVQGKLSKKTRFLATPGVRVLLHDAVPGSGSPPKIRAVQKFDSWTYPDLPWFHDGGIRHDTLE